MPGKSKLSSRPGIELWLRRGGDFLRRHRWSLPLTVLSALSFGELASELSEGELDGFDRAVSAAIVSLRGRFDGPMLWLTRLGDAWTLAVLSVAVMMALFPKRRREALYLACCTGGGALWVVVLKLLFARARPDGEPFLIPRPESYSFPSGHALGSTALFASLVVVLFVSGRPSRLRVAAALLAFLLVAGVLLSRVYLGVHYPSDVIGGAFAAAAWVSAVTGWFYPRLLPGEESKQHAEKRA